MGAAALGLLAGSAATASAGQTPAIRPAQAAGYTHACAVRTGYDGPTGWGSPDGTAAFTG